MQITKIALIQLYKILKVTKRCMQRLVICSSLVFVVPYKDMRGQYVQITKIRYLCFDFVHSRYTRMAGFGRREIELMQALCIYNIYRVLLCGPSLFLIYSLVVRFTLHLLVVRPLKNNFLRLPEIN